MHEFRFNGILIVDRGFWPLSRQTQGIVGAGLAFSDRKNGMLDSFGPTREPFGRSANDSAFAFIRAGHRACPGKCGTSAVDFAALCIDHPAHQGTNDAVVPTVPRAIGRPNCRTGGLRASAHGVGSGGTGLDADGHRTAHAV